MSIPIPKVGAVVEFGGRYFGGRGGKVIGHSVIDTRGTFKAITQVVLIVRLTEGAYLEGDPRTFVSALIVDPGNVTAIDGKAVTDNEDDDDPAV